MIIQKSEGEFGGCRISDDIFKQETDPAWESMNECLFVCARKRLHGIAREVDDSACEEETKIALPSLNAGLLSQQI